MRGICTSGEFCHHGRAIQLHKPHAINAVWSSVALSKA
jgi:hypothetical protein